MKRITEVLGGLFDMSAAKLAGAAGQALPANEVPMEALEQRQLMFGLTILPPLVQGAQVLPGTNLTYAAANLFAFPNQGGANNASATAQFGYTIPVLQQTIPAFQQFQTITEDFDNEWQSVVIPGVTWDGQRPATAPTSTAEDGPLPIGLTGVSAAGQAPLDGVFGGTTFTTEGTGNNITAQMRIDHRFSAGGLNPALPELWTSAAPSSGNGTGVSTGYALAYPLTGTAELDLSFVTDDATTKRSLLAAAFTVFADRAATPPDADGPGMEEVEGDIDWGANNTGNTQFVLLFRGVDVTSQFEFAIRPPGATVPDPDEVIYDITPSAAALAQGFYPQFDTIQLRRARVANVPVAGTDDFLIKDIVATVPSTRFAAPVQSRVFGADARVTGGVQFGIQQFDGQGLANPSLNLYTFPATAGNGLTSRLLMSRGNTVGGGAAGAQPTIANFASALAPANGAANNQALNFTLAGTQFVDFQFLGATGNSGRLMTAFSFRTSGAAGGADTGVLNQGTKIQAFRNGQLVNWTLPDGRIVKELTDLDLAFIDANTGNGWFRNAATADAANATYNLINNQGFDTIRISRMEGQGTDTITMDNVVALFPQAFLEDLYGRALTNTLDIGTGPVTQIPKVDMGGDGMPDFNDGIGRITLTGATGFTISGGNIELDTTTNQLNLIVPDTIAGIYEDFQTAGFGFTFDNIQGTGIGISPRGVPAGTGSVIIGSPFFRDPRTPARYHGLNPYTQFADTRFTSLPVSRVAGNQTGDPITVLDPNGPGPAGQVAQQGYQGRGVALGRLNFIDQPLDNAADIFGNFLPTNPAQPRQAPSVVRTQGIFAEAVDGASQNIASISVHGMLIGGSVFSGSVQRFNVGNLFGSVQFLGDVGGMFVAGDSGAFFNVPPQGSILDTGQLNATGSLISAVGTVGQIQIGGRSASRVLVQGNLSNPNYDRRDALRYTEVESIPPQDPPQPNPPVIPTDEATVINTINGQVGSAAQGVYFGGGTYRNDDPFAGAEFVGGTARSVVINGRLGLIDGFHTVEDAADSFAFTTTAGQELVFNVEFRDPPLPGPPSAQTRRQVVARVYDQYGSLVASHQYPFSSPTDRLPSEVTTARFRYRADQTGVYYLVLTAGTDAPGTQNSAVDYTASVSGLAPVSLGMYSSGLYTRNTSISVTSGNVGLIRNGAGSVLGDRTVGDASNVSATVESPLHRYDLRNVAISTTGDIHAMLIGGDVLGASVISIGGNLGTLRTGTFGVAGLGDFDTAGLQIGGSAGTIEIAGSVAVRTIDQPGETANAAGDAVIATGRSGAPGHINQLLIGGLIRGSGFTLRTSDNSIIDQFIVGSRPGVGGDNHGRIVLFQPTIEMGRNSDIRFARLDTATPFDVAGSQGRITIGQPGGAINENSYLQITPATPLTLEDDSGLRYTIRVTGVGSAAAVRQIPVSGSRGAAIARLDVILAAGGNLTITGEPGTGSTSGVISIGRINIQGAGNNSVTFNGSLQIDVQELNSTGALVNLTNDTPGGDIVSADVNGVTNVVIRGDLGRTQIAGGSGTFARNYARILGDAAVAALVTNNAINVQGAGGRWAGETSAPIVWDNVEQGERTLEDVGSPIDRWLNGLLVRTGGIASIRVNGSMGDVIAPAGTINSMVVNADGVRVGTNFDGIVGNIYANAINSLDIGDGLASPGDSPFPQAGIFANLFINSITGGTRVANPVISGIIIAAGNPVPAVAGQPAGGINSITLTSGRIENAFIGATTLDSFWRSPRFAAATLDVQDQELPNGIINRIAVTGGNIYGSRILAQQVNSVAVTRGSIDGSVIEAIGVPGAQDPLPGNMGTITADNIINTTRSGEPLEYRFSTIRASGNIATITVNNPAVGVIADTLVAVSGQITGSIRAYNFIRDTINIVGRVNLVQANNDVRATQITSGGLNTLTVGGDFRSSTLNIAGAITTVTITGEISAGIINSTGPNGRIGTIRAGTNIDAEITSSGPITQVTATRGDFSGSIRTTDASDGILNSLVVGRDILGSLAVSGNIVTITAGRHIGRRLAVDGSTVSSPDVISVDGTLGSITAGGQLYSDVLVGQQITGALRFGATVRAYNRPGGIGADQASDARIVAFGRINSIAITGDFAGSIRTESGGLASLTITNGSLRRPANGDTASVTVRDGDLSAMSISSGSLFGDVIVTDGSITSLSVTGTGAFGNVGINPTLSSATTITGDNFRNQLPPGVVATAGIDGPRIWAGRDLALTVAGSVFEAGIYAGNSVRTVSIAGSFVSDSLTDANGALRNAAGYIAAGEVVTTVSIAGRAQGLTIVGGLAPLASGQGPDLGTDNAIGGTGAAADTIRSGKVNAVTISGGGTLISATNTVAIVAGVSAGNDGIYATEGGEATEVAAAGLSTVGTVSVSGPLLTTAGNRVRVMADSGIAGVSGSGAASVLRSLTETTAGDVPTFNDSTFPATAGTVTTTVLTTAGVNNIVTLIGGGQVRIRLTGTNVAAAIVTDTADGSTRLLVRNTIVPGSGNIASRVATISALVIEANTTSAATALNNFSISTADDVTITSLTLSLPVSGASSIYVDGNIVSLTTGTVITSGTFRAGGDITTANIGRTTNLTPNAVSVRAASISAITFLGGLGAGGTNRVDARNLASLTSRGSFTGVVSIERDITTVSIAGGQLVDSAVRAGGNIATVTALGMLRSRLSARGNITTVSLTAGVNAITGGPAFTGAMNNSQIVAGVDLGSDGQFGGTGTAADVITNGNITTVTIAGQMTQSDVAAGVSRGTDGFFGTTDDVAASGRSNITTVRATGGIIPTALQSQSYRVISNGTVTTVTNGTVAVVGAIGNFQVTRIATVASPVLVTSLLVSELGGTYSARIAFSRAINASTLAAALSVLNVRSNGVQIALQGGNVNADYTVSYDAVNNVADIRFNRAVTTRNLARGTASGQFDSESGLPGPGNYRFALDASILRAVDQNGLLDGNSDGVAGDSYSGGAIVGDAGDRLQPSTGVAQDNFISFYGPASLDALLSANGLPNGAAASGSSSTVRGTLGDHPDFNAAVFNSGSDLDLYTITLQAGQVLRIGPLRGVAQTAVINVLDSTGAPAGGALLQGLPVGAAIAGEINVEQAFLVRASGQYIIAIGSPDPLDPTSIDTGFFGASAIDPTSTVIAQQDVLNIAPVANATGTYNFSVTVEADATSGFAGNNLARTAGTPVAAVPLPTLVNFPQDGTALVTRALAGGANFSFTYNLGTDALPGAQGGTLVNGVVVGAVNDDFVTGTNGFVTVIRTAGADQAFGTADDVITSNVTVAAGATVTGGNTAANLPGNASFTNVTDTVTRTATAGANFSFNLFLGQDNVRGLNGGANDDFIMGTNGGTVIVRTAGADGVLGDDPTTVGVNEGTDDVITSFDNRPLLLPLNDPNAASVTPAPLPDNLNFGRVGSVVTTTAVDGSVFTWRLDPGADGQRNSSTSANPFLEGDDIVLGQNAAGSLRVLFTAGTDGIFDTADDVTSVVLLTPPSGGSANFTAPLPTNANFGATAVVAVAATAGAPDPNFDFTFSAGPDGFRGLHNGRNDDAVSATANGVTATRTAGPDQLFGTADDLITPTRGLMSNLLNANVPVPADFATPTTVLTRVGTQADGAVTDNYTFFFRTGATAAQNTIVGYSSSNTITRTSGADGILGNGDDAINVMSNLAAGTDIPTPPRPSDFAGLSGSPTAAQITAALNSSAALPFIDIGKWRFTLDAGPNGTFNGNGVAPAGTDDFVVGTTATGQRIEYRAGATKVFAGLANGDVLTLSDAIGNSAVRGQPTESVSDVDVFNLNNGQPILAGTRYRVTLRTSETGSNFGALAPQRFAFDNDVGFQIEDLRGLVQFALFERTGATNINNGQLVAAPGRIDLFGGRANTTMAQNLNTSYGYDAAGDFYLEFTTPSSQLNAAQAGVFSLYIQGAVASRYGVEIRQVGSLANQTNRTQNIFIETQGGNIDWLESGGRTTALEAYDPRVNGFVGLIGTQTVLDYILNGSADRRQPGLIRALNDIFSNAAGNGAPGFGGSSVVISASNTDFVGQLYSTVFVTSTFEPSAFFGNSTFGAVQRVDVFNANPEDQSVVFAPALNTLGNTPTPAGVDSFIRDMTFIIGRQIGQLLGLRVSAGADPAGNPEVVDAMAVSGDPAGSQRDVPPFTPTPLPPLAAPTPGAGPRFSTVSRNLAGTGANAAAGTQFFLGQQNGSLMLRRIFGV
jgi:hypothetical protein